jgi:uncharacterized spore protein YtfJ
MDIRELLDKMGENLSVRRSFGEAYERDGSLIIPVALVVGGGGGGEGPIKQPTTEPTAAIESAEANGGGAVAGKPPTGTGGGFGGLVRPVGVYVVKGDQVRWIPAFDPMLIVLGGLGVLRIFMGLMRRRRLRIGA